MQFGRGERPDNTGPEIQTIEDDPIVGEFYEPDSERTIVFAFMLGGVVIAGGLLTLLYFGNEPTGSGLGRTDGFVRMESHPPTLTNRPGQPARPDTPAN